MQITCQKKPKLEYYNLKEVIEMLLEDGEPELEGQFIGTQNVMVA